MAGKYHLNPDTGNVSPCTATANCPFGGVSGTENHFLSPGEARAAYESKMKSQELATKVVKPTSLSSFNDEGLTDNMVDFRNDLLEIDESIKVYDRYRNRGLDNDTAMPEIPPHLESYLDRQKIYWAWKKCDYKYIRNEYMNAMKEYYVDNVFDDLDVDCMFDDDEIASLAGNAPDTQLASY